MFHKPEQHFTVFLMNVNTTHISLLCISSHWFQFEISVQFWFTWLSYPAQNLFKLPFESESQKHKGKARVYNMQESVCQRVYSPSQVSGSHLYEYLVSLCRNWEASLDYEYSKSVPKPEALLSFLPKFPTSTPFLQQRYSGYGGSKLLEGPSCAQDSSSEVIRHISSALGL